MLFNTLQTGTSSVIFSLLTIQHAYGWELLLGKPCDALGGQYTCEGDRTIALMCHDSIWEVVRESDNTGSQLMCKEHGKYCGIGSNGPECVAGLPPFGLLHKDPSKSSLTDDSCTDAREVICDPNGKEFYRCRDGHFRLTDPSRCEDVTRKCTPLNRVSLDEPATICNVDA